METGLFLDSLYHSLSRPLWCLLFLFLTCIIIFRLQPIPIKFDRDSHGSHENTHLSPDRESCSVFFKPCRPRKIVKSITEFGAIGDGLISNTAAFHRAVDYMSRHSGVGGSRLNIPRGRWVTGSFNLTSNFTLFLEEDAVILGSQIVSEWPIIKPLPSYGRGRERSGGRYISLIHGDGLENVIITGNNGSINGQGRMWWELWWNRTLQHTRGHLIELMNSKNILISNITLLNSPFWTVHPVYCRDVVIKGVTVLAPLHSPNTDGIDPDSSTNVCIEDCYIESGDDLVAIKSGWDQYGISFARSCSNIVVRHISGTSPTCSGVGIGSEMSGGIANILVDGLKVWDSAAGIRLKTDKGRGGYITNITITNMHLERVRYPFRFSKGANDHPNDKWDTKALPIVRNIFIGNLTGLRILKAPILDGIENATFVNICMKNITLEMVKPSTWQCKFVLGVATNVTPTPCPQLLTNKSSSTCQPW